MKLKLVKQGNFLGTKCDFYVDEENNIYMSRTQIGYALQYKDPANAIKNIHNKNHDRFDKMSVILTGAQFEPPLKNNKNAEKVYMYKETGIYAMCARSRQPIADDFNDWVSSVIISIRKNGYYISSEKDEKWIGIRAETKKVRRMETDTIKRFVEYAKMQGSTNAERYYQLFTDLVQKRLGIESGKRDKQDQETLLRLKSLETIVDMHIGTLMKRSLPYKEIFVGVRDLINSI